MPDSEYYLLLLHTLFFDHPLRMVECAKLFPNQTSLIAGFDVFLRVSQTSMKRQEVLRTRLSGFDPEKYLEKLKEKGIGCLYYHSLQYPECLRHISDPPLVLFYKGNLDLLSKPMLGVVGSRKATDYGERAAAFLVSELSAHFVIVSGLAEGIDTVAHTTTLQYEGYTVAVMGTGLDNPYPDSNKVLFQKIAKQGLVLTEYPLGTQPLPYHFPQRNRIISGLSRGVLVCEAGEKSGAMVTARLAIEQNREVFAIPGSLFSETSKGTHLLIQEGAKLVQKSEDILAEFQHMSPQPLFETKQENALLESVSIPIHLSDEETRLWGCLGVEALSLEAILEKTGMPVHQVLQFLTLFEMKDMVQQLPGKLFKKQRLFL